MQGVKKVPDFLNSNFLYKKYFVNENGKNILLIKIEKTSG